NTGGDQRQPAFEPQRGEPQADAREAEIDQHGVVAEKRDNQIAQGHAGEVVRSVLPEAPTDHVVSLLSACQRGVESGRNLSESKIYRKLSGLRPTASRPGGHRPESRPCASRDRGMWRLATTRSGRWSQHPTQSHNQL